MSINTICMGFIYDITIHIFITIVMAQGQEQTIADTITEPATDTNHDYINEFYEGIGSAEETHDMTTNYQSWSRIAEIRLLAQAGIQVGQISPKHLANMAGRGRMPRIQQIPAFARCGKVEELAWLMDIKEGE